MLGSKKPFLVGIVIGSILHLLILPWLHAPAAQASNPAISQYVYPTPDSCELLDLHLDIAEQLLGIPRPAPGTTLDESHLLIAGYDTGLPDSFYSPGASLNTQMISTIGDVDVEIYVLDTTLFSSNDLYQSYQKQAILDDNVRGGLVRTLTTVRHITMCITYAMYRSDIGDALIPIAINDMSDVTALAYSGATTVFQDSQDPWLADSVLLGAYARGVDVPHYLFRTQSAFSITIGLTPPSLIIPKKCGCDCDGDGIPEVPVAPNDPACIAINTAYINYGTCLQIAQNNVEACVNTAVAVWDLTMGAILFGCIVFPGVFALPLCIKGGALATGGFLLALIACDRLHNAAQKNCLATLKGDLAIACLSVCSQTH